MKLFHIDDAEYGYEWFGVYFDGKAERYISDTINDEGSAPDLVGSDFKLEDVKDAIYVVDVYARKAKLFLWSTATIRWNSVLKDFEMVVPTRKGYVVFMSDGDSVTRAEQAYHSRSRIV